MIQSFAYRNPRVAASLPVEFLTESGVLFGSTHDISEQGFLVTFGEPVLPATAGRVRFRTGHCLVELKAEVAHTEGFMTGLVFAFCSNQEKAFVRAILQALTRATERPGLTASREEQV